MMYEVIEEGNTARLITDKAGEMNAQYERIQPARIYKLIQYKHTQKR